MVCKNIHFCQWAILVLGLQITLADKLFRGSKVAKDWFTVTESFKSRSKIECVAKLTTNLKLQAFTPFAFRYETPKNICHYGNLGAFPGDLDLLPAEDNDVNGVYYPTGCLPKSSILGDTLELFFSYYEDNPKNLLIVKNHSQSGGNGSHFDRVPFDYLLNNAYTDFRAPSAWTPSAPAAILPGVYFAMPRPSRNPSFFDSGNKQGILVTTEPRDFSSFSIFAWMYTRSSYFDGILSYGETDDIKQPSFSFYTGWSNLAGYPHVYVKYGATSYSAIKCSSLWDRLKWSYVGVVFDSSGANVKFYQDGVQLGSMMSGNAALVNIQWTNLRYLYLGYTHQSGANYGWSPLASTELHSVAFTPAMAAQQYQTALTAQTDSCNT